MKTLIAYYSYTQNNEKLAKEIQRKLGCDMLKIEELKKRTWLTILLDLAFNRWPAIKTSPFPLKDYDHVICIAPIWAAQIASPLKTFLHAEKHKIKRCSFLTLCGGVIGQQAKIERQLTATLGKKPYSVVELWVNDLLPKVKKDTIKYTTGYKVNQKDFRVFESKINDFLSQAGIPFASGVLNEA